MRARLPLAAFTVLLATSGCGGVPLNEPETDSPPGRGVRQVTRPAFQAEA